MKIQIEVNTREEGEAIKRALADATIRATVLCAGTLLRLPTDRARERVLAFVQDKLDEVNGR